MMSLRKTNQNEIKPKTLKNRFTDFKDSMAFQCRLRTGDSPGII